MKRTVLLSTLLLVVLAAVSSAQAQPAQRTAEHDKLNFLVGQWNSHNVMLPGPWGAGGQSEGTMSFRWGLGEMWIVYEYEGEMPVYGLYEGLGLLTYSAPEGKYITYWFDSWGSEAGLYSGQWTEDGKTLYLFRERRWQGQAIFERLGFAPNEDGSVTFSIAMSTDGHNYQESMISTYTK